jgi:phenylalanyl-tRNA synthetase alpha chain
MANQIVEAIEKALADAQARLQAAAAPDAVEAVRIDMIGRKGLLPALSKQMGSIPPEERGAAGKAFNTAREKLQNMIDEALTRLNSAADAAADSIDLTLPGRRTAVGHKHPVVKVIDECAAIFRRMGFMVAEGPEIEQDYFNFDALNTPQDHPSRDPGDTFYFADGRLLRTQTSPVQIRVMESHEPPVRIVAPGRCFRRDTPDATHSMNFHQIEGLYIDKNVSLADLKAVLRNFATEMFGPEVRIRLRPHFFPFTEPSVEYDFSCIMCGGKGCPVCKQSGWLEIAGAGMVNPKVLENVGYDPKEVRGFAFGFGLERLAMLKHRINDLRLFSDNDVRFLYQF